MAELLLTTRIFKNLLRYLGEYSWIRYHLWYILKRLTIQLERNVPWKRFCPPSSQHSLPFPLLQLYLQRMLRLPNLQLLRRLLKWTKMKLSRWRNIIDTTDTTGIISTTNITRMRRKKLHRQELLMLRHHHQHHQLDNKMIEAWNNRTDLYHAKTLRRHQKCLDEAFFCQITTERDKSYSDT